MTDPDLLSTLGLRASSAAGPDPGPPDTLLFVPLIQWFSEWSPWATALASPGSVSEIQTLGPPTPSTTELETLGTEPSPLYFNKLSRGFRCLAKFENQCFSLYTVVLRGSPVRPQTTIGAFKGPLRMEEVPESWGRVIAVISKIDKEVIAWRQLLK